MLAFKPLSICGLLVLLIVDASLASPRRDSKINRNFNRDRKELSKRGKQAILFPDSTDNSTQSQNFVPATASPPQADCKDAGFFATPGTCSKFHRCVDFFGTGSFFRVFHFDCPAGTIFDPALSICNHAWAVTTRPECNGISVLPPVAPISHVTPSRPTSQRPQTPPPTRPTSLPVVTQPPPTSVTSSPASSKEPEETVIICYKDQIYRIHPKYCNVYYHCDNEEVKMFNCPGGLIFDSQSQRCSNDIECKTKSSVTQVKPVQFTSTTSTTTTTTTTTSEPTTEVQTTTDLTNPITSYPDSNEPSIVCYRDQIYRVHPKYCNMYYYCADKEVVKFSCPPGLIFDKATRSCSADAVCDTQQSAIQTKPLETTTYEPTELTTDYVTTYRPTTWRPLTVAPTNMPTTAEPTESQTEVPTDTTTLTSVESQTTTESPVDTTSTTEKVWEVDPDSFYHCGEPGYYPFEGDCIRFYKCVETEEGKLKGLLFKCPPKFAYSEEKKRCAPEDSLPQCNRVPQAAHLKLNIETATQVSISDLNWFFV